MPTDYPGAFTALRQILKKHAAGMVVEADTPSTFTVITAAIGPNKKPLWFGCVMSKKSAVTYHLMPLYYNRKLHAGIGPELLARMQGKTCFNFQRPDPALFARLDELTRTGREQWERSGFLEPGPISQARLVAALTASGEDPATIARKRKKMAAQAATKRASTLQRKRTKAGKATGSRRK